MILSFVFLSCSILSCTADENKSGDEIQERIKEDINNKLSDTVELVFPDVPLPKKKYVADKDHSSISFKTEHWEIVDLVGWFEDFDAVMYSDKADFTDAVISARVDPTSIRMPNIKMMGTAQKSPYIDSDNFPYLTFISDEMKLISDNNYLLNGTLQMNGIEREMDFNVHFNGYAYPGEQDICGFNVSGKFNRHDFKVAGEAVLHSGKKLHSDTIYLYMSLRME